jgi:hypothetical protein
MLGFTRRSLLHALAKGTLSTVGTVVLARAALADLGGTPAVGTNQADVQARAAEVAHDLGSPEKAYAAFRNVFRNGGGFGNGGFRNGGFRNGPFLNFGGFGIGGFRNGGFRNGGGGFRNVFRNG